MATMGHKLAPKDKSSTYMAIHTFLTGLRKTFCPLIGRPLQDIGASTCAWISFSMIILSTLMLLPVLSQGKTSFSN